MRYAADEFLTEEQACRYAPIIAGRPPGDDDLRMYEEDADMIYDDAEISVHLASLYVAFNHVYFRRESITCVVNMVGCGRNALGFHYTRDCESRADKMAKVREICGPNIDLVLAHGEDAWRERLRTEVHAAFEWLSIEGAEDNWYYDIGKHFAEVANFLLGHISRLRAAQRQRVNIIINCYAGCNRSAAVAIAFLLRHTGRSLECLLRNVVSRRDLVLAKPHWRPNPVQSRFLAALIAVEEQEASQGARILSKCQRRSHIETAPSVHQEPS